MKITPSPLAIVSILASLFLTGCFSSSGSRQASSLQNVQNESAVEPVVPSIDLVPEADRAAVKAAKTITPGGAITWTVDGVDVLASGYDFSALPTGFSEPKEMESGFKYGTDTTYNKGKMRIYNQLYSAVYSVDLEEYAINGTQQDVTLESPAGHFGSGHLGYFGLRTSADALDALKADGVKATYTGVAWTKKHDGALEYTVDFASQTGSGKITGLDNLGEITLEAGALNTSYQYIAGIANIANMPNGINSEFRYSFDFFGPKAEELGGNVFQFLGSAPAEKQFSIPVAGKRNP